MVLSVSAYSISRSVLEDYVDRMDIRTMAEQLFFVYVPNNDALPFTPGGIIPSAGILKDAYSGHRTIIDKTLHNNIPPFTGIDQEGGHVNRFSFVSDFPPMSELSDMEREKAADLIDSQALLMKRVGISVNFAPVVDIADKRGANMKRMGRIISEHPDTIIDFASFYMTLMKKHRILTTLKHFPGYGNTYYNSDAGKTYYEGTIEDYSTGLNVFSQLADKSDFIMVSNLIYPFIDSMPASMSSDIISQARFMNKYSIIITDDIACKAHENPFTALKTSFNAGADMFILMDHTMAKPMRDSIVEWINRDEIEEDYLKEKLLRIILRKDYLSGIIRRND